MLNREIDSRNDQERRGLLSLWTSDARRGHSLHYPLHSLLMLMISYVRILARLPRVQRLEILATRGHTPDRTWTLCGNSEVTCGLLRYLDTINNVYQPE